MGLVGWYSTHLYCDTPTCVNRKPVRGMPPAEYTGRTEAETWKEARKDGWHRHRNPHGGWLYFCGLCKNSPLFREG